MKINYFFSIYYEPRHFYKDVKDLLKNAKGGVTVLRGWSVTKIDPYKKKAYLDDGFPIKYEKCLIATGINLLIVIRII